MTQNIRKKRIQKTRTQVSKSETIENSPLKLSHKVKSFNRYFYAADYRYNPISNLRSNSFNVQLEPKLKQKTSKIPKYVKDNIIGFGKFGIIYAGHIRVTGERIAIKKIQQDNNFINRQLTILKKISHPNIIQLKDYFESQFDGKKTIHIITDLYETDLSKLIIDKKINHKMFKNYAIKLIQALLYLRTQGIVHRDLKPDNILIGKGKIVISDFGLAKQTNQSNQHCNSEIKSKSYIGSRYYRAPELILGAQQYGGQIDVWSLGCIFAEIINGKCLFKGSTQVDQFQNIMKIIGTPSIQQIKDMNHKYCAEEFKLNNKSNYPNLLANAIKSKDKVLIDLISSMLQYSPLKRATPLQLLLHPYLNNWINHKLSIIWK